MNLALDHIEKISNSICTFWFRSERPLEYLAGQYVELTLSHRHPDTRGTVRWFTLSSSPSEKLVAITTKTGVSSFKKALWHLQPGDNLKASEAIGDFVLPKDPRVPLVFVAGGIGITPVLSMVKWLVDQNEKRDVHILYAVRKLTDLAFIDFLKSYVAHIEVIVGQVEIDMILASNVDSPPALIYLSGSETMVESLHQGLIRKGLPNSQIVLDAFPGYHST